MTHWKWLSNHPKKQPSWSAAIEIAPSKNTWRLFFIKKMSFSDIGNSNKFSEYFLVLIKLL